MQGMCTRACVLAERVEAAPGRSTPWNGRRRIPGAPLSGLRMGHGGLCRMRAVPAAGLFPSSPCRTVAGCGSAMQPLPVVGGLAGTTRPTAAAAGMAGLPAGAGKPQSAFLCENRGGASSRGGAVGLPGQAAVVAQAGRPQPRRRRVCHRRGTHVRATRELAPRRLKALPFHNPASPRPRPRAAWPPLPGLPGLNPATGPDTGSGPLPMPVTGSPTPRNIPTGREPALKASRKYPCHPSPVLRCRAAGMVGHRAPPRTTRAGSWPRVRQGRPPAWVSSSRQGDALPFSFSAAGTGFPPRRMALPAPVGWIGNRARGQGVQGLNNKMDYPLNGNGAGLRRCGRPQRLFAWFAAPARPAPFFH